MNGIAVAYNRKIFSDLGLSVPRNWDEFLQVCETIKQAGIYPVALGIKDAWVTQLIPYAMAPSMIYAKNINFDRDMYDGKAKFNGPEWTLMMERYKDLETKGYFSPGSLGTNYDQANMLVATGKAAMVVQGNWVLSGIRQSNSSIELGMFPLPAANVGEDVWISSAVGGTVAVTTDSQNIDAAKMYLRHLMTSEMVGKFVNNMNAFSPLKGVQIDSDSAMMEMAGFLDKSNTYTLLDQNWPKGPKDVLLKGVQEMFGGKDIAKVLQDMDNSWMEATSK